MIVRILGDGQFDVSEGDHAKLDEFEKSLNVAVEGDDEAAFTTALAAVIAEVRKVGLPLPPESFTSSDLVVPFDDATLAETKALLSEPGGDDH